MPGIFISYRRDDAGGYAGRLYDRLSRRFGREQIFMDIDAIPIGHDFVQVIDERIRACNVMVALIGKNWLTLTDRLGQRRMDDPADFVRLEIEAALARNIVLIPVLVGGAHMPAPQDLPGSIVRLAYLNAFEVYDRMFEESVSGLILMLRPLVKAPLRHRWRNAEAASLEAWRQLGGFWISQRRKRPIVITLAAIVCLLLVFSFIAGKLNNWFPAANSARETVELPHSPVPVPTLDHSHGVDAGAKEASVIQLKSPIRVSKLPPIVESARHVLNLVAGFGDAVGPHHPEVLWRADFSSLDNFLGLAEDGTLYFGGGSIDLNLGSIYAIRDAKQQWGYSLAGRGDLARALFSADGRVWVEQQYDSEKRRGDSRFFVYNSRGEGGLTSVTEYPTLAAYANTRAYGWGKGGVSGWTKRQKNFEYKDCELGELSGSYFDGQTEKPWKLKVDGSCGAFKVNEDGDLLTVTDTGTLYCVSLQGQIRWTRKIACQPDALITMGREFTVYACASSLHALREGEPQWDFKLEREPDYSSVRVDKANTLYLLSKSPFLFLAIDNAGKLLWQIPFDSVIPLGLDKHGRMYIKSQSTLMCFSERL